MRLLAIPALVLCLSTPAAAPAVWAEGAAALTGQTVAPRDTVVLYSTPNKGLFSKQQPAALARSWNGETTLYNLTPDGGDFVVGEPMPSTGLEVIGSRTIVRDGAIQEWVQVEAAGQSGWVQYQSGSGLPTLDAIVQEQ